MGAEPQTEIAGMHRSIVEGVLLSALQEQEPEVRDQRGHPSWTGGPEMIDRQGT